MSFIGKIFRNSVHSGGSLTDISDFWYGITGGKTKAGVSVNDETAIKYLAVFACVSLISGDIAKLPLNVFRTMPDGTKKRMPDHPLSYLLSVAPNDKTSSFNWREFMEASILLIGNAYSEIKREPRTGNIKALIQIPGPVTTKIDKRRGRFYEFYRNGKKIRKFARDIFHIAGPGSDGITGRSMIDLAREDIGLGLASREYGSNFFGKGTNATGMIEMDKYLGDNQKDLIKNFKEDYAGLGNSHNVMLLQGGMKFKSIAIPLNDSQFLETRKFQNTEICSIYHVPPHKIAIHDQNSNRSNLEQENSGYVDTTLMPWFVRWEQAIGMQLLGRDAVLDGYYVKFNANALLRGDSQARAEYYQTMFNTGSFSPNMILEKEDMNPIEGGDQHFVQLSYVPLDMAGDFAKEKTETKTETKSMVELKEYRAKNSIQLRDRIAKRYYPLFKKAGQDIVDMESIAVKRQVKKQQRGRENRDMQKWLDSFYRNFPDDIKSKIGPVIRAYSEAISEATIKEIGIDDDITKELDSFINDYIDTYAGRHTQSSLGQLTQQLDDSLDALTIRVDEWEDKRPEKIADDEIVRNSSAVYQFVAFGAGLSTVWRNRGKTCPYCKSLNGKRVSSGQSYVGPGDKIDPEGGTGPMRFSGIKAHPPLHQKCDCYLSTI